MHAAALQHLAPLINYVMLMQTERAFLAWTRISSTMGCLTSRSECDSISDLTGLLMGRQGADQLMVSLIYSGKKKWYSYIHDVLVLLRKIHRLVLKVA